MLQHFAAHFGIDLLAFAVMSNHFHLILRNRPDVVGAWDDSEVARRWLMICPHRSDKRGNPMPPTDAELDTIRNCPLILQERRARLADVSWWMRLLCQRIATRSNQEDGATGHFFQERFRAIRLVDEASLLACSAYVDLNPIRAEINQTIETSDHTSAQRRIEAARQRGENDRQPGLNERPRVQPIRPLRDNMLSPLSIDEQTDNLGPDASLDGTRCSNKGYLAMSVLEYIELLDWTARQSRPGKSGKTPQEAPPVVQRLGLSPESWCELVNGFGHLFHHVAGNPATIDRLRSHRTGARFRVKRRVRSLMPPPC